MPVTPSVWGYIIWRWFGGPTAGPTSRPTVVITWPIMAYRLEICCCTTAVLSTATGTAGPVALACPGCASPSSTRVKGPVCCPGLLSASITAARAVASSALKVAISSSCARRRASISPRATRGSCLTPLAFSSRAQRPPSPTTPLLRTGLRQAPLRLGARSLPSTTISRRSLVLANSPSVATVVTSPVVSAATCSCLETLLRRLSLVQSLPLKPPIASFYSG